MRLLGASALIVAALTACGTDDGSAAGATTGRLTITVWPQGVAAGSPRKWTLECGPAGGTHPAAKQACARLPSLLPAFKPVPKDVMCTQIYGGPAEARVTGTFRGNRLDARFNLVNGCEIARWNRVAVLFPIAAGAQS